MKKAVILTVIALTALLFWAPWMGEDGGEKVIRKVSMQTDVRAELNQLKGCEGLSSSWAPFGRRVQACENKSWYVIFWGQRF